MSDYKKKKQLLDENKDMYISEYDKSLSYDALSRIVDAKKDFINAAKSNDKYAMTKANNVANGVRAKYGSYTGGNDGSEYHPFYYSDTDFDDYESKYEDELDRLYSMISAEDTDEFSYNYEDDPVYKAYKDTYNRQGNLAYDRALAENSLRTGGMENTNAHSAATQALSYYNAQLASKIPELYRAAYDRYYTDKKNNYNKLVDSYNAIKNRESRDYQRYLDDIEQQKNMRDFLYKQKKDIDDRAFEREQQEAKAETSMRELDAKHNADLELANVRHNNTMAENAEKFQNEEKLQNMKQAADKEKAEADFNFKLALQNAGYENDLSLQNNRQDFNAMQNLLQRNWDAEQSKIKRAWDAEQNTLDRNWDAEQNKIEREWKSNENTLDRNWDAQQNDMERDWKSNENALDRDQKDADRKLKAGQLLYEMLQNAIDDEKWRSEYNMDAHKNGFSYYQGDVGTGNILGYARKVFGDPSITMEDLYRILGI